MKKIITLLSLVSVLLISCTGGNSYTMETFYNENKSADDTTLISENDVIKAESDSAAFIKAQEKYNELMSATGNKKGMPVKFIVRNSDDVIITGPGLGKTHQIEKEMYPNQKP